MKMSPSKFLVLAAAQFAVGGTLAGAGNVLQFDVNSLTADAGGEFDGTSHTGTITLGQDGTTTAASILINGTAQMMSSMLSAFKGSIDLVNGQVVGGGIALSFDDGSMYSATIQAGAGSVKTAADPGGIGPGPYTIDAVTDGGAFSNLVGGTHLGGVDVSQWSDAMNTIGSFIFFKFGPNDDGFDNNTDIDVFVTAVAIPLVSRSRPAAGAGVLRRLHPGHRHRRHRAGWRHRRRRCRSRASSWARTSSCRRSRSANRVPLSQTSADAALNCRSFATSCYSGQ